MFDSRWLGADLLGGDTFSTSDVNILREEAVCCGSGRERCRMDCFDDLARYPGRGAMEQLCVANAAWCLQRCLNVDKGLSQHT